MNIKAWITSGTTRLTFLFQTEGEVSMSDVDHLLIKTSHGNGVVACLCGDFSVRKTLRKIRIISTKALFYVNETKGEQQKPSRDSFFESWEKGFLFRPRLSCISSQRDYYQNRI
jgi:hypothetical protein